MKSGSIKKLLVNKFKKKRVTKPLTEKVIPKNKLILNTSIFFNNLKSKVKFQLKRFKEWFWKDSVKEIIQQIITLVIHGSMGASIVLSLLLIFQVNLVLVHKIALNTSLTLIILIIGCGALYYFIMDFYDLMKKEVKQ